MKIHFVINSLVAGGAERVMILLANYFSKKGLDVTIITFNLPDDFNPDEGVKRIRLHGGKIKNHTIRSIYNLSKLYSKKSNRPDVMIPFMTHSNFIGIIVGKLFRIKVVSSEHNNHLKKTDFIGNLTKNKLYKFTTVLTVLTAYDKKFYDTKGFNVTVMPNPCTFKAFNETKREREKIILAVGDLNRYHHKGFDNLIPVVAPVLKRNPDWKLKLVGAGDKGTAFLKELVEKHEISDQVIFTGYSNKVSQIMKESEIYIMSSRFEGLPMVLLEAMSQGMACISYDCVTGPSEIITHDVNGILVEDQNQDALRASLEELVTNETLRLNLSKKAPLSLDKFNIDLIYKKYLNIFDTIVKK